MTNFKKGEIVALKITDAADGNKWFGTLLDGLNVFVNGNAVIGDMIEARITKIKKNYLEARLVSISENSEQRCRPLCLHFGTCGGCKWQHFNYSEQIKIKERQLINALKHIGNFTMTNVEPIIPSNRTTHYRNKIEYSFSNKRFIPDDEMNGLSQSEKPLDFALGFHAPKVYSKVVDIDICHIATLEMNKIFGIVKSFCLSRELQPYSTLTHEGFLRHLMIRQSLHTKDLMVNFVTSRYDKKLMNALYTELSTNSLPQITTFVNNVTSRKCEFSQGENEHIISGDGIITERLGSFNFQISSNSFFQTNTAQAEILYQQIDDLAQLNANEIVYDLYCGAGSISIYLASKCKNILGMELNEESVIDAKSNAKINDISNCSFTQFNLNNIHANINAIEEFGPPDVIVTDPPRAGMHQNTLKCIGDLNPNRIIYVSCNPASFARDTAILNKSFGYRLEKVVPIDMFPFTNHVECVGLLFK